MDLETTVSSPVEELLNKALPVPENAVQAQSHEAIQSNEIIQGHEAIVTEVKVKKDKIFLSLRSLGSLYVAHRFRSPKKRTAQARWDFGSSCSIAEIDAPVYAALLKKQDAEKCILDLESMVCSVVQKYYIRKACKAAAQSSQPDRQIRSSAGTASRSSVSKIMNLLNSAFEQYNTLPGQDYQETFKDARELLCKGKLKKAGPDISEIIEKRKQLSDQIAETNKILGYEALKYYDENKTKETDQKKYVLELSLKDLAGIRHKRMLTAEELRKQKWAFLDIEIPNFDSDSPEISWVGVLYHDYDLNCENGSASKRKMIFTLRDIGCERFKDYSIIKCNSEEDLVARVAGSIISEDPFIVSVYNAPFDLIKLRQTKDGFKIGLRKSGPKKEVSVEFMQRIGIYGRQVFDLMRVANIAYSFLPNQKLGTVLNYELRNESQLGSPQSGFKKSLSYAELGQLDARSEQEPEAGKLIAEYLTQDLEHLPTLAFKEGILEAYAAIMQAFNLELTRASHMPRVVRELRERNYFKATKEFLAPRIPVILEKERKNKEYFYKTIITFFTGKKRTKKQVSIILPECIKAYLPIEDFLQAGIIKKYPQLEALYAAKHAANKENKDPAIAHDPAVTLVYAAYLKAFCNELMSDISEYSQHRRTKKDITSKMQISEEKAKQLYFKLIESFSENARINFYRKRLRYETAEKYLEQVLSSEETSPFEEYPLIPAEDAAHKQQLWTLAQFYRDYLREEKRFGEKYPKYNRSLHYIKDQLNQKLIELKKFLETNNISPIYMDSNFIYLKNTTAELEEQLKEKGLVIVPNISLNSV